MNKKIRFLVCMSLLLGQGVGSMTVLAGDGERTDSTVSADTAVSPSKKSGDTTTSSSEEVNTPDSSLDENEDTAGSEKTKETTSSLEEDSDSQSPSPMRAPAGTTLIEGVDIDADFATLLREDSTVQTQWASWSGYGKAQDQLTVEDMASIVVLLLSNKNLNSLKGIEYAENIVSLDCSNNSLTELDITYNTALTSINVDTNQLTELDVTNISGLLTLVAPNNLLSNLDVTNNLALTYLNVDTNQLTELDITHNIALFSLSADRNQLTELNFMNNTALLGVNLIDNYLTDLDFTHNTNLTNLSVDYNQLTRLDVTHNTALTYLAASSNQIADLDVTHNTALKHLNITNNQLTELNVAHNIALLTLSVSDNQLKEFDVTSNTALTSLEVVDNQLTNFDVTYNTALTSLNVDGNELTELDVTNNIALTNLTMNRNQLVDLDVTHNTALSQLDVRNNHLTGLNVANNIALSSLYCAYNAIYDITFAFGLTNLTTFDARMQSLEIEMPLVVDGNTSIDLLKTTASTGLSVSNAGISGAPVFSTNGDIIELSNVSYAALANGGIDFDYSSADLAEGSSLASNKQFSGTIRFKSVSILTNQLISNKTKVASGDLTSWSWTMESVGTVAASNIKANLALPSGLTIDSASIKVNGSPGTIADIDGTNNLGSLNPNETIEITFNTTAIGNAGDWLEAVGNLEWEDSNTKTNQSNGAVQIKDDEQTFTPKKLNDMALLSTPESFRFGTWDVKNTAQIITLQSTNYLTNTQVVSDGFYTRLRDDRSVSTGWKLSAQLSEFKDSSNSLMPNSSGASLRMEDVALENITDRDTPAEAINPSPIGIPSTVVTDETLVAGQTAKPLVTANSGEGIDTWQIRIPFNKVSLNLPANAGQRNTNYSATLTWSLDDTP